MLTADLVRAEVRKGVLRIRTVDVADAAHLERADELIALFEDHVGQTLGDLNDALSVHVGDSPQVLLHKGLVKLLMDRSTFETSAVADPAEVRRRLFELAADEGPVSTALTPQHADDGRGIRRSDLIERVAAELGVGAEQVEESMFADLKDNQRMTAFERLEPEALLHRYNTALAQAVLLRATRLVLEVKGQTAGRYRSLFRAIKFYGLIHAVSAMEPEGWRITLDGPLSLFRLSQKYGLQMASFLPVVLLMESGYSLSARVDWSERAKAAEFTLGPELGLRSHLKDRGVWVSEEERWFVGRFRELGGPWTLDDEPRLLQLAGGDVVVPDYALRHEDGREVFLEIVWFWRKASLEPRLKMLAKKAPPNLILAVSDRLRASKEDLEACPVPLHRFKGVLLPKPLIALAEKAAKPAPKRRGRAAGAGSAPSGPARKRRASRPAE